MMPRAATILLQYWTGSNCNRITLIRFIHVVFSIFYLWLNSKVVNVADTALADPELYMIGAMAHAYSSVQQYIAHA